MRSASSLKVANNSLDESIALVTAANTVVQNPESVGTTLKTLTMRLRGAKTELEEAGEDTEGMAASVSKLRSEIFKLTNGSVDIMADNNTFKSTYQILQELSQVWDKLTDITQANILEMIAGKRNANVAMAILSNFDVAEQVLEKSVNAAGSAMQENDKYLESINGRIERLTASYQIFSNNLLDNSLIKAGIEGVRFIVDLFNKLDEITSGVSSRIIDLSVAALALIAVWQALKSLHIIAGIVQVASAVKEFLVLLGGFKGIFAAGSFGEWLTAGSFTAPQVAAAILGIVAAIVLLTKAIKAYKDAHPSTEELYHSAQETKAELDEVNNQLESTKKKMDELKAKGKLSITEETELKRLEDENAQLKRRKSILEELYNAQNRKVSDSAVGDYYKTTGYYLNSSSHSKYRNRPTQEGGRGKTELTDTQYLDYNIGRLEQYQRQYEEAQKKEVAASQNYGVDSKEYANAKANTEALEKSISGVKNTINETYERLSKTVEMIDESTPGGKAAIDEFTKAEIRLNRVLGQQNNIVDDVKSLYSLSENDQLRETLDGLSKGNKLTSTVLLGMLSREADEAGNGGEEGALSRFLRNLKEIAGVEIPRTEEGMQSLIDLFYATGGAAESVAESADKLFDKVFHDGLDKLSDGFNTLQTAKKELKDGLITDSTLNSMSKFNSNIDDTIALYKMGLITAKEVYSRFESLYKTDRGNFEAENYNKIIASEEFYNKHVKNNEGLVSVLGDAYTSDYKNWVELAKKKAEVDRQLISKLGSNWAKYFTTYANAEKTAALNLMSPEEFTTARDNGSIGNMSYYEYQARYGGNKYANLTAEQRAEYNARMATARELDALASNLDFSLDFTPTKKSGGSSGSSSGSSTDKNKQAAQERIKILKHQLEMEEITQEQYYDELEKIRDSYYADEKKYAEERLDIDEELFKGRTAILEDFLNDQKNLADRYNSDGNSSAVVDIYRDNLNKIKDLLDKALKEGYSENGEFVQKLRKLYKDAAKDIADAVLEPYERFQKWADDFDMWDKLPFTKGDFFNKKRKEIEALYKAGEITRATYEDLYNTLGKEQRDYYKSSIEQVIDATMEMLEQEAKDMTDALDDQIDKYKEIVDLKKKALQTAKDEQDHEEEIADAVKEIAKLQSKIAQLSLDDSREAAAKRAELEEQLAEKQKALGKLQRDYSIDQTTNALDEQQEAFEKEKEAEKKATEESVDSWVKRYEKAIDMLNNDWDGTYKRVIEWSEKFKTSIDGTDSIKSAFDAARQSVLELGVSLNDIMSAYYNLYKLGVMPTGTGAVASGAGFASVESIMSQMKANSNAWTPENGAELAAENVRLAAMLKPYGINPVRGSNGTWYADRVGGQTLDDWFAVYGKVNEMARNSSEWKYANANRRKYLEDRNQEIADTELASYGIRAVRDPKTGIWYVNRIGGEQLYKKYPSYVYHHGGVVGDRPTANDNEVMALLERGEYVLDSRKKSALEKIISVAGLAARSVGNRIGDMILPFNPSKPSGDVRVENNVTINHNGAMSEADAKRYGNIVAETSLEKLREAFNRRGI